MTRRTTLAMVVISLAMLAGTWPAAARAQRGGHAPTRPPGHVAVWGHTVFVGG
jgi:hypothetical protein